VVSTFDLTPAPAPLMVSPRDRRGIAGSGRLDVRFHAKGGAHEVIGLLGGSELGLPHDAVSTDGREDGLVTLPTRHLRPGHYNLVLLNSKTLRTEASASVWVYRKGSRARITTGRHVYRAGRPISVSWTRAPGNNLDWVSLFPCHVRCAGPGGYTIYRYTETAVEGSLTFGRGDYLGYGSVRSLPPGQYVARVLTDDGYHAIGKSARFRIVRR
jgi:hypothetical protein